MRLNSFQVMTRRGNKDNLNAGFTHEDFVEAVLQRVRVGSVVHGARWGGGGAHAGGVWQVWHRQSMGVQPVHQLF